MTRSTVLVGLLVAGGLVAGGLLAPVLAGRFSAPPPPVAPPPPPGPEEAGAERFLAGLDLAREERWAEARTALEAAARAGVPEAPESLARLEGMLAARAAARGIREQLASGDLWAAGATLREMAPGLPGLAEVEREVREAVGRRRGELAARLAGQGAGEAAREEWNALATLFPEEMGAPPEPPRTPRRRALSPIEAALASFRAGRLAEARAAAAGCHGDRCRSLEMSIAAVEAALAPGATDAAGAEAAVAAVRALGGSAPLERALGQRLAPRYHAEGLEALRRGDLARARERFDRALAARPDHEPSRLERQRLRERAQETFLAAYAEKDATPDRARQKFRLVTTITGPDEELHRKARSWLERLEPRTGNGGRRTLAVGE